MTVAIPFLPGSTLHPFAATSENERSSSTRRSSITGVTASKRTYLENMLYEMTKRDLGYSSADESKQSTTAKSTSQSVVHNGPRHETYIASRHLGSDASDQTEPNEDISDVDRIVKEHISNSDDSTLYDNFVSLLSANAGDSPKKLGRAQSERKLTSSKRTEGRRRSLSFTEEDLRSYQETVPGMARLRSDLADNAKSRFASDSRPSQPKVKANEFEDKSDTHKKPTKVLHQKKSFFQKIVETPTGPGKEQNSSLAFQDLGESSKVVSSYVSKLNPERGTGAYDILNLKSPKTYQSDESSVNEKTRFNRPTPTPDKHRRNSGEFNRGTPTPSKYKTPGRQLPKKFTFDEVNLDESEGSKSTGKNFTFGIVDETAEGDNKVKPKNFTFEGVLDEEQANAGAEDGVQQNRSDLSQGQEDLPVRAEVDENHCDTLFSPRSDTLLSPGSATVLSAKSAKSDALSAKYDESQQTGRSQRTDMDTLLMVKRARLALCFHYSRKDWNTHKIEQRYIDSMSSSWRQFVRFSLLLIMLATVVMFIRDAIKWFGLGDFDGNWELILILRYGILLPLVVLFSMFTHSNYYRSNHSVAEISTCLLHFIMAVLLSVISLLGDDPGVGILLVFIVYSMQVAIMALAARIAIFGIVIVFHTVGLAIVLDDALTTMRKFLFLFGAWLIQSCVAYGMDYHNRHNFFRKMLLAKKTRALSRERQRTQKLLSNILPPKIMKELQENPSGSILASSHEEVTVLFTDLRGFTAFSSSVTPKRLVNFLNVMFSTFDRITHKYGIQKIEIIGDAYFCVAGCPTYVSDHAERCANAALEMLYFMPRLRSVADADIRMRIGIHTGPAISGVVGTKDPRYHLFGNTVETAMCMECEGVPDDIQISDTTYLRLHERQQRRAEAYIRAVSRVQRARMKISNRKESNHRHSSKKMLSHQDSWKASSSKRQNVSPSWANESPSELRHKRLASEGSKARLDRYDSFKETFGELKRVPSHQLQASDSFFVERLHMYNDRGQANESFLQLYTGEPSSVATWQCGLFGRASEVDAWVYSDGRGDVTEVQVWGKKDNFLGFDIEGNMVMAPPLNADHLTPNGTTDVSLLSPTVDDATKQALVRQHSSLREMEVKSSILAPPAKSAKHYFHFVMDMRDVIAPDLAPSNLHEELPAFTSVGVRTIAERSKPAASNKRKPKLMLDEGAMGSPSNWQMPLATPMSPSRRVQAPAMADTQVYGKGSVKTQAVDNGRDSYILETDTDVESDGGSDSDASSARSSVADGDQEDEDGDKTIVRVFSTQSTGGSSRSSHHMSDFDEASLGDSDNNHSEDYNEMDELAEKLQADVIMAEDWIEHAFFHPGGGFFFCRPRHDRNIKGRQTYFLSRGLPPAVSFDTDVTEC